MKQTFVSRCQRLSDIEKKTMSRSERLSGVNQLKWSQLIQLHGLQNNN